MAQGPDKKPTIRRDRKPLSREKIARELRRFGRQILAMPRYVWSATASTFYYDRYLSRQVRGFEGREEQSDRLAIFVVYPDQGLQPSHLRCMDYFRERNVSLLVVSNLELSEADRTTVLNRCWRYIERPNVGYDFGAYREGVLDLGKAVASLRQLILINDSVWFPMPGARDWLDDVDALGVDYVGASSHGAIRGADPELFENQTWEYRTDRRNFHYASYALSISERILKDPGFLKFWKSYKFTEDKNRVVRRGEIGLSNWTLKRGYSHGATFDISDFNREIEAASSEDLAALARGLIIPGVPFRNIPDRVFELSPDKNRDIYEKFVLCAVARQGAGYALAEYAILKKGFPFLKSLRSG